MAFGVDLSGLTFMHSTEAKLEGKSCLVSCGGYTGIDGSDFCIPSAVDEKLAKKLLGVEWAGLAAGDSLSWYGHDLNEDVSNV